MSRRPTRACLRSGRGWQPKKALRSEQEAQEFLRQTELNNPGRVFRYYQCEHCFNYHISTHPPPQEGTR